MQTPISLKVAEAITALGPKVQDAVVDALVKRELDKRSQALVTGIDSLAKQESAFYKLGPDVVTYDADGKKASETFSKARIEERKKAGEKIEKLGRAITKALEKDDFGDLYNIANNKDEGERAAS